jgi:hypothetical protein
MAHRDLDAALQLLAFRAQYITQASGAAIAIRRRQHNDMLCRASAGSNAPELGTLLSTESGLSGESVRTRLPLLCVDTERDPRVNRDGCRELGIASVAVMPILGDDGVLGVFELFSGQAGAFGERDLTALKRLAEMAESAVALAEAAQTVARVADLPPIEDVAPDADVLDVVDADVMDAEVIPPDGVSDPPIEVVRAESASAIEVPKPKAKPPIPAAVIAENPAITKTVARAEAPVPPPVREKTPAALPPKKPLLWSAALQPSVDAAKAPQPDRSHVPAVLRDLRKCWACGFPVSEGRRLCVECEDKQWRGQLRAPTQAAAGTAAVAWTGEESTRAIVPQLVVSNATNLNSPGSSEAPSNQAIAFAAKAGISLPAKTEDAGSGKIEQRGVNPELTTQAAPPATLRAATVPTVKAAEPKPSQAVANFNGGMGSSESWLASNKYIMGAILLVAVVVAAIFLLR